MPDVGSSVSRSLGMSVPRAKQFGVYRKLDTGNRTGGKGTRKKLSVAKSRINVVTAKYEARRLACPRAKWFGI